MPGRLPMRPILPLPPANDDDLLSWARAFHDELGVRLYESIARQLTFSVNNVGSASFGAADTSNAVAFEGREFDAGYRVTLTPSWNTKLWYSALAVTGFTINASDAPGGAGGTVVWTVIR